MAAAIAAIVVVVGRRRTWRGRAGGRHVCVRVGCECCLKWNRLCIIVLLLVGGGWHWSRILASRSLHDIRAMVVLGCGAVTSARSRTVRI